MTGNTFQSGNSGSADKKTAGAVMLLLTTDSMETLDSKQDPATLSKQIQKECCFNKRMADILADIALTLIYLIYQPIELLKPQFWL